MQTRGYQVAFDAAWRNHYHPKKICRYAPRCDASIAFPDDDAIAWIAERLKMGSRGHLAWLLGQSRKDK
jgi:hypothetical protein